MGPGRAVYQSRTDRAQGQSEDEAARDTLRYFTQILSEDHELASFDVVDAGRDDGKVYVSYTVRGQEAKTVWFDREAVEQLANDLYGAAGDSEHF